MRIDTSLNRNILYLSIVQGSAYILPLLTFPYLVRVLNPEFFGVLGFCQASIQYLVILTDYGFNWTATQNVVKYNDNKKKLTRIFWSVIWSKTFLGAIAGCILIVACLTIDTLKEYRLVLVAFSPMVIGNIIYPLWFFQGMERMKWITLCTISARLFLIPLTFLFVKDSSDVWIAALIQGGTNLIAGVIGGYLIYKNNWIGKPEFLIEDVKKSLIDGWHVFISMSAISLYTTSVVVILGVISGPVSVGYFNTANTIRNAAQGLLTPISQAIYPRINSLYNTNYNEAITLIKKSLRYLGLFSLVISVMMFILAPYLIKFGAGYNYGEAISVLRVMSPLPFIIALSNVFGVQTMLTHQYKKQFSKILLFSGVFNMLIIYPLISGYAADGAALSVLLTEVLVTVLMYFFLRSKKIFILK